MDRDDALREHVLALLTARQAHCTFEDAVAALPPSLRGERPEELPYSPWELVEHIRRAQHDILVYCQDPTYEAPSWPEDYWPDSTAPPKEEAWKASLSQVQDDRDALCALIQDPSVDLYDTVPSSNEHTYLREFLLVADHNAYHVGQLVSVRRLLGIWPPSQDAVE